MKKVYHLKTCSTNRKILAGLDLKGWDFQEIKAQPITDAQLDELYQRTQSYEALFSRKSTQIKALGIDVKSLKERDFKKLLIQHYSFLKRPVFLTKDKIYVGSEIENVAHLQSDFGK